MREVSSVQQVTMSWLQENGYRDQLLTMLAAAPERGEAWTSALRKAANKLCATLHRRFPAATANSIKDKAWQILGWYVHTEHDVKMPKSRLLEWLVSQGKSAGCRTAKELALEHPAVYKKIRDMFTALPETPRQDEFEDVIAQAQVILHEVLPHKDDVELRRIIVGIKQSVVSDRVHQTLSASKSDPIAAAKVQSFTRLDVPVPVREQLRGFFTRSLAVEGLVPDKTNWLDRATAAARAHLTRYMVRVIPGAGYVPKLVEVRAAVLVNQICRVTDSEPKPAPVLLTPTVPDEVVRRYLLEHWPKRRVKRSTGKLQRQDPQTLQDHARWLRYAASEAGQTLDIESALACVRRIHDELVQSVQRGR